MATLATIFDRLTWARSEADEQTSSRTGADSAFRLRAIPNDDIYFYVKPIDNSKVVRVADPASSRACWKSFGLALAGVAFAGGLLAPALCVRLNGYQIESLRQEQHELQVQQAQLALQETVLRGPQRAAQMAAAQDFIDPTPQSIVYLDDNKENRLAQR